MGDICEKWEKEGMDININVYLDDFAIETAGHKEKSKTTSKPPPTTRLR